MPTAVLAPLSFPDGKPLPPSLRRWLAYDASFVKLFADPAQPTARGAVRPRG